VVRLGPDNGSIPQSDPLSDQLDPVLDTLSVEVRDIDGPREDIGFRGHLRIGLEFIVKLPCRLECGSHRVSKVTLRVGWVGIAVCVPRGWLRVRGSEP
jgi:hypothetical protein